MNDAVCKLPKLKSFSCQRLISKGNKLESHVRLELSIISDSFAEFMEGITEAYPIVEYLRLTTYRHKTIPPDHTPILTALRFPHLTSLSLSNFQLLDGAALLPVRFKVQFRICYSNRFK